MSEESLEIRGIIRTLEDIYDGAVFNWVIYRPPKILKFSKSS